MGVIKVGPQAHRLLLILAQCDDDDPAERLSAAEWEAACTVMGLQVAFRGNLPAAVAEECHRTVAEVARRTGLPLFTVRSEGGEAAY